MVSNCAPQWVAKGVAVQLSVIVDWQNGVCIFAGFRQNTRRLAPMVANESSHVSAKGLPIHGVAVIVSTQKARLALVAKVQKSKAKLLQKDTSL